MIRLFTLAFLFLVVFLSHAQEIDIYERLDLDSNIPYDENIMSPSAFLEYELGSHLTIYADVVAYFKALNESTDKMIMKQYGTTYEGRKLYSLVISSPENMGRIEEIRQANLDLMGNAGKGISYDPEVAKDLPVFVSFSYNIHGNEASSTEAAMQVAYRLVASQDDATKQLLDDAVIIIFPMHKRRWKRSLCVLVQWITTHRSCNQSKGF